MMDIVERLRGSIDDERTYLHWQHEIMCEGADEIERLREKLRIAEEGFEEVMQPPPYVFTRDIAAAALVKLRK